MVALPERLQRSRESNQPPLRAIGEADPPGQIQSEIPVSRRRGKKGPGPAPLAEARTRTGGNPGRTRDDDAAGGRRVSELLLHYRITAGPPPRASGLSLGRRLAFLACRYRTVDRQSGGRRLWRVELTAWSAKRMKRRAQVRRARKEGEAAVEKKPAWRRRKARRE